MSEQYKSIDMKEFDRLVEEPARFAEMEAAALMRGGDHDLAAQVLRRGLEESARVRGELLARSEERKAGERAEAETPSPTPAPTTGPLAAAGSPLPLGLPAGASPDQAQIWRAMDRAYGHLRRASLPQPDSGDAATDVSRSFGLRPTRR